MNRISSLFENKKSNILSVYFTAGYPQIDDTLPILRHLQKKGIDMVEIGIPFSDPMADGPVIQNSSQKALRNGMTLRKMFDQISSCRTEIQIPLILMGYLNPIFQFGFEHFCQKCQEVGIDGVIVPDLPFDNFVKEYQSIADKYDLRFIFLITPETSEERIREIDRQCKGFLYMVSSTAITGTQQSFNQQVAYFTRINEMNLQNPKLIGFGASNAATYQTACRYASGAIIGSAFVKALGNTSSIEEAIDSSLLFKTRPE